MLVDQIDKLYEAKKGLQDNGLNDALSDFIVNREREIVQMPTKTFPELLAKIRCAYLIESEMRVSAAALAQLEPPTDDDKGLDAKVILWSILQDLELFDPI